MAPSPKTLALLEKSFRRLGLPQLPEKPSWCLAELRGRLTELGATDASAQLTLALRLVLDAQQQGEPAAWMTGTESAFFPPDAAQSGIDLEALPVLRLADCTQMARAADLLLRSGAFGLVILDWARMEQAAISAPLESRLLGLAQKHDAAVLFLSGSSRPAWRSSLVSLRACATRQRRGVDQFLCTLEILKDKRRGPGWTYQEICHGPAGLR